MNSYPSLQEVSLLVENVLNEKVTSLHSIPGGMLTHAVYFDIGDKGFVVRIANFRQNFERDRFIGKFLGDSGVPVPEVVEIGECGPNQFFAISERVAGSALTEHTPLSETLFHALSQTLCALHSVPVQCYPGFGEMNADGIGRRSHWHELLLSVHNEQEWSLEEYVRQGKIDANFLRDAFNQLDRLTALCPERKALLHGDVGLENVFSDGEVITGLIDWGNARYGDPLFDLAWTCFWFPDEFGTKILEEYCKLCSPESLGERRERVACFGLHIGLAGTSFFLRIGQHERFEWTYRRTQQWLKTEIPL